MFSNYHTHTKYCDGKDEIEYIVKKAISLGCPEIGFSGHSYTPFDESYCMSKENTKRYKEEINFLKKKYKDRIKILLGIEKDYYSDEDTSDCDFVIGSVHYILKNGKYLDVDYSKEVQVNDVNEYYNGDYYAYIHDYYKLVSDVVNKTKCNIIGHFDLVTKFNQDGSLFDTNNSRYKNEADKALEKLIKTNAIFELNTGAISSGYKTEPYPSKHICQKLFASGKKLLFSSDCHNMENLLFDAEKYKNNNNIMFKIQGL